MFKVGTVNSHESIRDTPATGSSARRSSSDDDAVPPPLIRTRSTTSSRQPSNTDRSSTAPRSYQDSAPGQYEVAPPTFVNVSTGSLAPETQSASTSSTSSTETSNLSGKWDLSRIGIGNRTSVQHQPLSSSESIMLPVLVVRDTKNDEAVLDDNFDADRVDAWLDSLHFVTIDGRECIEHVLRPHDTLTHIALLYDVDVCASILCGLHLLFFF